MIEPSNSRELMELYEYNMKNMKRVDGTVDYRLLEIGMLRNYESTYLSSCSFSRNMELSMAISSSKRPGVEDFKNSYTSEKRVTFFRKYLSLSRMGNEGEVILRPCSKMSRLT